MNVTLAPPERSLWPAVIVAWFILFASGIVAFIIFAQGHHMELVGADYYDQEIRFQQQLDRISRTRPFSREVSIDYEPGSHQITVNLPSTHASKKPAGKIHLYRPSDADLDRLVNLAVADDGRQLVDTTGLRDGLWRVRVIWTVAGDEFSAEQSVVISRRSTVRKDFP